jgi:hypothetical protein
MADSAHSAAVLLFHKKPDGFFDHRMSVHIPSLNVDAFKAVVLGRVGQNHAIAGLQLSCRMIVSCRTRTNVALAKLRVSVHAKCSSSPGL